MYKYSLSLLLIAIFFASSLKASFDLNSFTYFSKSQIQDILNFNSSVSQTNSSMQNSTLRNSIYQSLYWSDPFFNTTIGDKLKWTMCPSNATTVGIMCGSKYCERMTPVCAHLKTTQGDIISWDRTGFPKTSDNIPDVVSLQYFGDNSGKHADPTANKPVPDRDMGLNSMFVGGLACFRSYCGLLGIYYSSIVSNFNYSYVPQFMSPPRNTSTAQSLTYAPEADQNPNICSWTNVLSSDSDTNNVVTCPQNKLLTGIRCSRPHCESLWLYCCPLMQAKPQNCVYSPFQSVDGCKRVSQSGTQCTQTAGTQVLNRTIVYDGIDGGEICNVANLNTMASCNPCYRGDALALQTAYSIMNSTIQVNATKQADYNNHCSCKNIATNVFLGQCYNDCTSFLVTSSS